MSDTARVLVADDQPDILEALRWLLAGEGTMRSSSIRLPPYSTVCKMAPLTCC
jgi:hypothetical protein